MFPGQIFGPRRDSKFNIEIYIAFEKKVFRTDIFINDYMYIMQAT